ncbi:DEKNAAC101013 [Brettanomyces naardenensis]|uniref:DEKNAAC101013 n=1 Tax=Brettanomyces naardenensis TaxID=13370 RepID=A0A448YGN8_BRENA|nr:DEKNAAC101013 [Brettanomyces naardenensis]
MTLLSGALKIKSGELVDTIHSTAEQFGAKNRWGPEQSQTGVRRLALSDLDKGVKDWFVKETKSLGCTVKIDEVGNIFATYPGRNNDAKPTGMGSHLDTQPTGGRYDGIFGVLSGLQVLRTLKANNYVPNYPITLVDWCNEEGARFAMSIMASSVWAGISTKEHVYALKDVYDNKTTVLEELNRIGYKGTEKCSHMANPLKCHFEIHIEQGPILEKIGKKIGVLTSAQAYTWIEVTFKGMPQHTGTTPMDYRRDSLLATGKVITGINDIAKKYGGVATVGKLSLSPNVVNVIPGEVNFVVDIRHEEDEGLHKMYKAVRELLAEVILNKAGNGVPLEADIEDPYPTPAAIFNSELVDLIDESAKSVVGEEYAHRMISGAGHDSCATNTVIPTAMIFVPSKNGISHNPEEYTKPEELEDGFRVLLETVLRYDESRTD